MEVFLWQCSGDTVEILTFCATILYLCLLCDNLLNPKGFRTHKFKSYLPPL